MSVVLKVPSILPIVDYDHSGFLIEDFEHISILNPLLFIPFQLLSKKYLCFNYCFLN